MRSLGHENRLKLVSQYSKNRRHSSRISVDKKLIIFKELINDGSFYIFVVCQRRVYKKSVFCNGKIALSHTHRILIWLGCLIVIYIFLRLSA